MPKNNRIKNRNTFIAVSLGVGMIGIILFKILFPVFSVDSKDKEHFLMRDINGKKYLEIRIRKEYPFRKIVANLNLKNKNKRAVLGKVYQDEIGLYPTIGKIDTRKQLDTFLIIKNKNNLKNGELIQKNNSVYFMENGIYRAFSNAETFDRLGFDWQKVHKNKAEFLTTLKKGKNITLATTYLDGSFVQIGREVYLIKNEKKYQIDLANNNLIKFIENNFSVIFRNKNQVATVGKMNCQKTGREVTCRFRDYKKLVLPRASILIEVINKPSLVAGKVIVQTIDKIDIGVAKITLRNIKERLEGRYAKRFGIE